MNVLQIVLTALTGIASLTTESGTIATIIATLENIITAAVAEVQAVAPMIKNIITALKNNSAVTADQMAQLEALDAATDQVFEAAAAAAGLPAS